jgi:3-hydroxyacyl-CoA dehydrogenase
VTVEAVAQFVTQQLHKHPIRSGDRAGFIVKRC